MAYAAREQLVAEIVRFRSEPEERAWAASHAGDLLGSYGRFCSYLRERLINASPDLIDQGPIVTIAVRAWILSFPQWVQSWATSSLLVAAAGLEKAQVRLEE